MVINRIVIFFSLFLLYFLSKGQELYFVNISQSLNLPSDECYDVVQDKQGFIWISAEKGLLKLSGTTQVLYTKNNSVLDGDVYSMTVLNDSTNLFVTSARSILQNTELSLIPYKPLNDIVKSIPLKHNDNPPLFYNLYSLGNGDFFISNQRHTYILHSHKQYYSLYHPAPGHHYDTSYVIETSPGKPLYAKWLVSFEHDDFLKKKSTFPLLLKNNTSSQKVELDFRKTGMPNWRVLACKLGNVKCFAIQNKLIIINNDLTYKIIEAPKRIIALFTDSQNALWVGCHSGGGYYFEDVNKTVSFSDGKRMLSDFSVSGFCKDREGNMWCTTLEKGVFFSANSAVTYFPGTSLADRRAKFITPIGNKVYSLSKQCELYELKQGTIHSVNINTKKELEISDIAKIDKSVFLSTKGYLFEMHEANNTLIEQRTYPWTTYQLNVCNGKVYALGKKTVSELGVGYGKEICRINSVTSCMKVINDSMLYVGSNDGVYLANSRTHQSKKLKGFQSRINCILQSANGSLLVSSETEGLGIINETTVNRINNILLPDCINDMAEDRYGDLWLATPKGIISYDRIRNRVYSLNGSNGIMPGNINKIAVDSHFIYASSQSGLLTFSLTSNLYNHVPPGIKLKSVKIDGVEISWRNGMELSYTNSTIEFEFDVFTYKKGGSEGILYRLVPFDTLFNSSSKGLVNYRHLTPGSYSLTVYAVNNNGIKSLGPLTYSFVICPPYWQTPWFIALYVLLFLILTGFVVWLIIKRIRHKEQEKSYWNKLVSDSQLSALQAQMNPHFIFNAINSIQNYILDKDEKRAYDYLSRFSKLIRKVLGNSCQSEILLVDELETLQLYIDIERLRFENDFEYIVHIDKNIDVNEEYIPTMVIQPYVENAIWHGLINLKNSRKGQLTLSISKTNHCLHIAIDDNGIGREKAAKLRQNNIHQPEGMSITQKRIELINKQRHETASSITIIDKYEDNGTATGTLVEITIKTDKSHD